MGKCRFEEAINSMKGFLHNKMGGTLVSADTKELMQSKLDALALIELQVRKLQGTVRVAQVEASALTKVSTEDKLLKVVNGNVTNQKGITSIQVTSMDMLKQVSREFVELMKANRNYSGKEQEGYDEWFSMLDKAGIEFKPFKLSFKKAIAGEGYGRHYTATGNIEVATMLNYGSINPRGVLLHEYVHRITADNLNKYPVLKAKTSQLMSHVKKYIKGDHYGMTNEYEFLAEVASNPKFQEELSKIPPMNKNQSILDTVKSIIKSIIDRMSNKEKSALTEGLELVIEAANEKGKGKDYSESNDISWMQEGPKVKNGKIDVTDPVASMKVLNRIKDDKEQPMIKLWMIGAKESVARNIKVYNTWKEKDAEWLRSHGFPIPKRLVTKEVAPQYYNAMDYLIQSTVNPSVKTVADLTTALANIEGIKFARYTPAKNSIMKFDYSNNSVLEYLKDVGTRSYIDAEMSDIDVEEKAVMETYLKNNEAFIKAITGNHNNNDNYIRIWADYLAHRNPTMLSHELIHAGSSMYMVDNPDSALTKKMEELYNKAIEKKDYINKITGGDDYWSTNVHEFVAEGLTNPLVMQALDSIVHEEDRNSVFRDLVETALKMLGFKSDTVYSNLLESYMQIVRERKEFSPEIKEMAKLILQGMKDCK